MATHDKAATPKRRRQDWATKIDPESGEQRRFCTQCEAFLPFDKFYPSCLARKALLCKTHALLTTKPHKRRWMAAQRGAPGSVQRVRTNLNAWIVNTRLDATKWTEADVELALLRHNVDADDTTRTISFRPRDTTQPFSVDNSVVKYRRVGGSGKTAKSDQQAHDEYK